MATNKNTLEALRRMAKLVDELKESSDSVKELKTWNKMFKRHIGEQKSQGGQFPDDRYECDWKNNKIRRWRKDKLVKEY